MKKEVVVIGLGRFGSSVAKELYQMGHDVLAIDPEDQNVQDICGEGGCHQRSRPQRAGCVQL